MKPTDRNLSRRRFLSSTLAASAGAYLLPGCAKRESSVSPHPLDGISRENIKITDITMTPLSYIDPNKDLWRSDSYTVWKTDAAITRVYNDQGIIGIGEGTPYAGGYRPL